MMKMVSISSCFDYDIPLAEQCKLVAQTGFTHISLGSGLKHSELLQGDDASQIRKELDINQLLIDSVHFS